MEVIDREGGPECARDAPQADRRRGLIATFVHVRSLGTGRRVDHSASSAVRAPTTMLAPDRQPISAAESENVTSVNTVTPAADAVGSQGGWGRTTPHKNP